MSNINSPEEQILQTLAANTALIQELRRKKTPISELKKKYGVDCTNEVWYEFRRRVFACPAEKGFFADVKQIPATSPERQTESPDQYAFVDRPTSPVTEYGDEPSIETFYEPPRFNPLEAGEKIFAKFVEVSDRYIQKKESQPESLVVKRINTNGPIAIAHISDLHFGAAGTHHSKALHHAKLIGKTPGAFAINGGDGIDNFIKHASAMVNATSNPEEQYAAYEFWCSLFGKDKVLGMISGNHDYWTKDFAGIDYLREIHQRLGITYAPFRLCIELYVNDVLYRIEVRHRYLFKSNINLSNQFLRMWERSDWQWDIGLVGHTHDGPFYFPFERHNRMRYGSLAGSYKIHDSYGKGIGFNNAKSSSPIFILNHERYEVTPVEDLDRGIDILNAMRQAG
jgi:hypothetical protein